MRFKQFVEQDVAPQVAARLYAQQIFTHCKPFLQSGFDITQVLDATRLSEAHALFRGFSSSEEFFKMKERAKPRQPVTTSIIIHNALNDGLEDLTGTPYRSFAAFATGDYNTARDYGDKVFMMFPIGKLQFCWSPKIDDAYTYFDDADSSPTLLRDSEYRHLQSIQHVDYPAAVREFIASGKAEYQETELTEAIESGNEIMLLGDYYLLNLYSNPFNSSSLGSTLRQTLTILRDLMK